VTPRSHNRRPVNKARVRHRLCCGNSGAQLLRASSDGETRFAHLRASGTEDFPRNLSCRQPPDLLATDLWSRTAGYGVRTDDHFGATEQKRGESAALPPIRMSPRAILPHLRAEEPSASSTTTKSTAAQFFGIDCCIRPKWGFVFISVLLFKLLH